MSKTKTRSKFAVESVEDFHELAEFMGGTVRPFGITVNPDLPPHPNKFYVDFYDENAGIAFATTLRHLQHCSNSPIVIDTNLSTFRPTNTAIVEVIHKNQS